MSTLPADERWLDFNVNYSVRVRLTEVGLVELRRRHDEMYRAIGKRPAPPFEPPRQDDDGWTRFALWDLMNQLGSLCRMGLPVPFETTIKLDTEQRS